MKILRTHYSFSGKLLEIPVEIPGTRYYFSKNGIVSPDFSCVVLALFSFIDPTASHHGQLS